MREGNWTYNKYCHTAQNVSKYLSTDPSWHFEWWNYITALRGCDYDESGNGFLKALFTCVLRGRGIRKNDVRIAWDISYVWNDEYYSIFTDETDWQYIRETLNDESHFHYKHHLARGFEALAFYNKGMYENTSDEVYKKCGSILDVISLDLDHNCNYSVFDYIHQFLLLVSEVKHD